eukprot:scaffold21168_cov35-Tisochrysis_lutea.AAC.7
MAKIADAFGAHRYNYPAQYQKRVALLSQVRRLPLAFVCWQCTFSCHLAVTCISNLCADLVHHMRAHTQVPSGWPCALQVLRRLDELSHVMEHITSRRASHLARLASRTHAWRVHVTKHKASYQTLNRWNYDLARKVH